MNSFCGIRKIIRVSNIFLITDSLKKNGWGEFTSSSAVILSRDKKKSIYIISRTNHERIFPSNVKVLRLYNTLIIDIILINIYHLIFKPISIHFCSEKVFEICKFYNHKNIIQTIHGTYGYLFEKKFKKISHKINTVTFDSVFTKNKFKNLFKNVRSKMIYPLSNFYLENEHNDVIQKNRKHILFIGNSKKRKGLEVLLKAYEKITNRYNDINLVLVGNFDKKHSELFSKNQRIEVFSGINNNHLIKLIRSSIVNVLPSINIEIDNHLHFEGFGLVHIESNILGTPTIGSHDCGNTDIIKNNFNGFLIHQNNVNELSEFLYKIIDKHNKDDYSLYNNSIQIKNTFNSIDFYKKIINAYGI